MPAMTELLYPLYWPGPQTEIFMRKGGQTETLQNVYMGGGGATTYMYVPAAMLVV